MEPEIKKIGSMIDALISRHARANTIGILVAVPREAEAIENAFKAANAKVRKNGEAIYITHDRYRAVVCQGKSLAATVNATRTLIDTHNAKWVIMSGIAGSLGTLVSEEGAKTEFKGPEKGHVVVAASIAPFHIREKERTKRESVPVPYDKSTWTIIPTDPELFRLAHKAGEEKFGETGVFHEGLIITGTGIKDSPKARADVLNKFADGLAVEEEGYLLGLVCMTKRVPYLVIRGISDLVGGKAAQQQAGLEQSEQSTAAAAAADLTVKVVHRLSEQW
jgi:nucleoside phosphorylase